MDSATSPSVSPPGYPAQGDFASVPAPDLFVDLIRRRFTGTLRVDRSGIVKVIYFSQGELACASSNAEEDRLGNLLVRTGCLAPEQLAHAKSRQSERASIGNTLVELGYITAAELLEGARRQVEEIVTDLMLWREGTYQARAVPLSRDVVNLALPARAVVVRALQQISARELVVERLGSMEAVLARAEPFDEAARALDFGFPVELLLAAIDGRRSVREICEAVDMEDFQACKVLYTLLSFGLLRPAGGGAPRELVFVEGELRNGETLPRAEEERWRWGRRRASRAREAQARPPVQPAAATAPPAATPESSLRIDEPAAAPESAAAPEEAEEAAQAGSPLPTFFAEEGAAGGAADEIVIPVDEEPRGVPPARPRRRFAAPALAWKAALALVVLALLGGILYFAYFRPTLSPEDAEEARLLTALMDEARRETQEEGSAPEGTGTPHEAARPQAERPEAERPEAERPRREAPPLENRRLLTMLSADANFRSAMDLMKQRRYPEAAEAFRRALEARGPDVYTIQLLLACQDSTLERAFERAPDRTLYFVSTTFRGQACYRLLDGLYASDEEARRELARVPGVFLEEGNRPVVVRAPRR